MSAKAPADASRTASFRVDVTADDAIAFAKVSGDWNPLHTNPEHAARTAYKSVVLHGAFSAGMLSRMAGMHLPGEDCLLHGMRLRFIKPIIPPATLSVEGKIVAESGQMGRVEMTVTDAKTATRYVEGSYEFSRHEIGASASGMATPRTDTAGQGTVVVTGATGGLGKAVIASLGTGALGTSRSAQDGLLHVADPERIAEEIGDRKIDAIVHCAWPAPDNQRLTALKNVEAAVEHNVAAPLRQVIALAQLLRTHGSENAMLVLVGSTAASPGRHLYRMPLYTLAKSLVPTLSRVLAVELGATQQRCVGVTFDVIEGGMNKQLTPAIRAMHADRAPSGELPSADQAAAQIAWVLANRSFLASGATIDLSGTAIP